MVVGDGIAQASGTYTHCLMKDELREIQSTNSGVPDKDSGVVCHWVSSATASNDFNVFFRVLDCLTLKTKALQSFKMSGPFNKMVQCHNQKSQEFS